MKIRPVRAEFFHTEGQADKQTDRHDVANPRYSHFFERDYKVNGQNVPFSMSPRRATETHKNILPLGRPAQLRAKKDIFLEN